MQSLIDILTERVVLRDAIATAILIIAILLVRRAALRVVRRASWASEEIQLRWTVQVRWTSLFLLGLGLVVIWASELRTLALSVVALAVAIVIATKELILCLSGSILRATSRCFSVGDRIEVAGVRGDVVDLGALTTTILETGHGHRRTGRAIVIPNSILLASPLINERLADDFVFHVVTVPIAAEEDWQKAEQRLLAAADEVCAPFLEEARKYMHGTAERHGPPGFVAEPSLDLQPREGGNLTLLLRVPVRARDKGRTEQQILRRFLASGATKPRAP